MVIMVVAVVVGSRGEEALTAFVDFIGFFFTAFEG